MKRKIKVNTSTSLSVNGERPSTMLRTALSERSESNGRSRTINLKNLKFDKQCLIPAVIQDYKSGEVLMLAYMNEESLRRTLKLSQTCFWSRSRKKYWVKGETSGNYQYVKSIAYDCDMDALLIKVRQVGVACHTGNKSCFYRRLV